MHSCATTSAASMPLGSEELQTYTDRLRIDGDTAFLQYRVTLNGSDGLVSFRTVEALTVKDGLIVKVNEHAVLVSQAPMSFARPHSADAVSRLGLSARQVGCARQRSAAVLRAIEALS